MSKLNFQHHYS